VAQAQEAGEGSDDGGSDDDDDDGGGGGGGNRHHRNDDDGYRLRPRGEGTVSMDDADAERALLLLPRQCRALLRGEPTKCCGLPALTPMALAVEAAGKREAAAARIAERAPPPSEEEVRERQAEEAAREALSDEERRLADMAAEAERLAALEAEAAAIAAGFAKRLRSGARCAKHRGHLQLHELAPLFGAFARVVAVCRVGADALTEIPAFTQAAAGEPGSGAPSSLPDDDAAGGMGEAGLPCARVWLSNVGARALRQIEEWLGVLAQGQERDPRGFAFCVQPVTGARAAVTMRLGSALEHGWFMVDKEHHLRWPVRKVTVAPRRTAVPSVQRPAVGAILQLQNRSWV